MIIFGPKKLPELSRNMGLAIKNCKDTVSGIKDAKYEIVNDEVEHELKK